MGMDVEVVLTRERANPQNRSPSHFVAFPGAAGRRTSVEAGRPAAEKRT